MDEKTLQELLIKLGIPTNRSYTDLYELLDAKLSEYLDRQDEASQNMVPEIQDALEYAEQKKKEAGGGIALAESVEQPRNGVDMDELRSGVKTVSQDTASQSSISQSTTSQGIASVGASATGMAASAGTTASAGTMASTGGSLWFASRYGADNIDKLFYRACDDLKYQQYEQAASKFDQILDVEPDNAGAYLGKAMAEHQLQNPNELGTKYDKVLDDDVNLRRAYDHGNDMQKKYINDALTERRCGIKYAKAQKAYEDSNNLEEQKEALRLFEELDTYRDSKAKADECRERVKRIEEELARLEEERKSRFEAESKARREKVLDTLNFMIAQKNSESVCKDKARICANMPSSCREIAENMLELDILAVALKERADMKIPMGTQSGHKKYTSKECIKLCNEYLAHGSRRNLRFLKQLVMFDEKINNNAMSGEEKQAYREIIQKCEKEFQYKIRDFQLQEQFLSRAGFSNVEWRTHNSVNKFEVQIFDLKGYMEQAQENFKMACKMAVKRANEMPTAPDTDYEFLDKVKYIMVEVLEGNTIAEKQSTTPQNGIKEKVGKIFGWLK